jgi:transcriptional regulator with XRE-family HTH domain
MPGINGEFVRDFRVERAWSQEQLAKLCGLSVRTVARAEGGGRPSLDSVKALAAAFGVSPASLMNGDLLGPLVKRITPMTVLSCIGPSCATTGRWGSR